MINKSSKILTLSTDYKPPKGGIAQVIQVYSTFFSPFNHIATKKGEGVLNKFITGIKALFKLLYYLLLKDIEIVHVHGASYNSFWRKRFFIYISKLFHKKIVYHIHGGKFHIFYGQNKKRIKKTLQQCETVLGLNEYWKNYFENIIGHPNVKVIENVVSTPVFKSVTKDNKTCHFLFLGMLGFNKGIYDLLEVISSNRQKLERKAIFHLGGNGEVDKVKNIIKANNLEGIVKFEGWVSGDIKAKLLSSSDVYILPSYNEGVPISILEAMSYRLPILSTVVGGIPELVENDVNGLLVKPGDKVALEAAILKMIENREFRVLAGQESYKKVQPHFPEKVEKKLNSIYQELLKE